jgi:cell division septum initiation protein DivIVA
MFDDSKKALEAIVVPRLNDVVVAVEQVKAEVATLRVEMNVLRGEIDHQNTSVESSLDRLSLSLENASQRGDRERDREVSKESADLRERITRLEANPPRSLPQ